MRHAGPALGAVGAQLGQPAVVGPGARPSAARIGVSPLGAEAGAERRRRAGGHRVGVGEDHLAGHAVGVELLVAPRRVPAAAQALLVLALPLLGELLVEDARAARARSCRARSARLLVERVAVLGVEPLAVLLVRQPGVAVATR